MRKSIVLATFALMLSSSVLVAGVREETQKKAELAKLNFEVKLSINFRIPIFRHGQ